jgi:hypothetical protein
MRTIDRNGCVAVVRQMLLRREMGKGPFYGRMTDSCLNVTSMPWSKESGSGGFVETSGKQTLNVEARPRQYFCHLTEIMEMGCYEPQLIRLRHGVQWHHRCSFVPNCATAGTVKFA